MPTAGSSASTAQPASADRSSGSGRGTTTRKSGSPRPSTPPSRSRAHERRVMNMQNLALGFLAATTVGGLAWVFIYPMLSGERQAAARREQVAKPEPAARRADNKAQKSRREQVEGSLKEIEARAKENKATLSTRLTQAGLDWTPQKFWTISGVLGIVGFAVAFIVSGSLPGAIGIAFAFGFGVS